MSGPQIEAIIQRGYRIASKILGRPFDIYRPYQKFEPMKALAIVGQTTVSFDRDASFPYQAVPHHQEATRYALVDGLVLQHGDYLVPAGTGEVTLVGETAFVAQVGYLHPTLCFSCNAIVSLRRVAPPVEVGHVGYRATATDEQSLLSGWPASITMSGGGSDSPADLPGGGPIGSWDVLLPRTVGGVNFRNSDVLEDSISGRRYLVLAAELSSLGWRLSARSLEIG